MAEPYSARFRDETEPSSRSGDSSVKSALDTLESHATTPQQHSAIKSLRNSFEVGPSSAKPKGAPSPGQRASRTPGEAFEKNAARNRFAKR